MPQPLIVSILRLATSIAVEIVIGVLALFPTGRKSAALLAGESHVFGRIRGCSLGIIDLVHHPAIVTGSFESSKSRTEASASPLDSLTPASKRRFESREWLWSLFSWLLAHNHTASA